MIRIAIFMALTGLGVCFTAPILMMLSPEKNDMTGLAVLMSGILFALAITGVYAIIERQQDLEKKIDILLKQTSGDVK